MKYRQHDGKVAVCGEAAALNASPNMWRLQMNKIRSWLSLLLFAVTCLALNAQPVHAQATRTWVSGVGDDANPCSRTAPCKTFAGAISKTAPGGIINCLDPGGFGAVTITKSITIDCSSTLAGVLASGTNGINVNAAATDIVRLRGLDIEGVGTGLIGVNVIQVGALRIENCKIWGFNSGSAIGILFAIPSGVGSELYVTDSIISENGIGGATGGGIVTSAAGTATGRFSLDRVRVDNNSAGVRIVTNAGGTGQMSLSMRNSTANGNSANGITILSTPATVHAAPH